MTNNELDAIQSGLASAFGTLSDSLDSNAAPTDLPIIGNALSTAIQSGQDALSLLPALIGAAGDAIQHVKAQAVQSGLNALASTIQDALNAEIAKRNLHGSATVTVGSDDAIAVHVVDSERPAAFTTALGTTLGTGNLGLTTTGTASLTVGLDLDETVTIDPNNNFAVTTSGSGLKATVDADALGFSADARLGPAQFKATDNGSSISGAFTISAAGAASYTGTAKLAVHLAGDLGSAAFPSISADLDGSWNIDHALVGPSATGAFGDKPTIGFDNVTWDLGQFFDQFLKPVLDFVKPLVQPIQTVLAVLNTDLTFVKTLLGPAWHALDTVGALDNDGNATHDGKITLLDFIKAGAVALGQTFDFGAVTKALNALQTLTDVVAALEHLDSGPDAYNLGSFTLPGDIRDAAFALAQQVPEVTKGAQNLANALAGLANGSDVLGNGLTVATTLGHLTDGTSPIQALALNPAAAFATLLGANATLLTYTLPKVRLGIGSIDGNGDPTSTINLGKFPVFPGIDVSLDAAFQASLGLDIGFDTTGLAAYAAGGFQDPSQALNGLWISNPSSTLATPLLQVAGSIGLNVNAGIDPIAYVSGGGDIGGDVNFYLPEAGKDYLPELEADIAQGKLFDSSGELTAGFDASVNTLFGRLWQGEFPRIVLASYNEATTPLPATPPTALGFSILALKGQPVAKGLLLTGDVAQIRMVFDKAVDVRGSATLSLNDGGTAVFDRTATVALGDPNSLVFDYAVKETDFSILALGVMRAFGGIVEGNIPDGLPARGADTSGVKPVTFDGVPVDTAVTRTFVAGSGDFATQGNWDRPYVTVNASVAASGTTPASTVTLNLYGNAVIAAGNAATFGAGSQRSASMESLDVQNGATLAIAGGAVHVTGSIRQGSAIDGLVQVAGGGTIQFDDILRNGGTIALNATADAPVATLAIGVKPLLLAGGGFVQLSDAGGNRIVAGSLPATSPHDTTSPALENVDNTIAGAGAIGSSDPAADGLPFQNDAAGLVLAKGAHPLQVYSAVQNAGGFVAVGAGDGQQPTGGLEFFGDLRNSTDGTILGSVSATLDGLVTFEDGVGVTFGTFITPGGDDTSLFTTQGAVSLDGDSSPVTNQAKFVVGDGSTLTVTGRIAQDHFSGAGANAARLSAGGGHLVLDGAYHRQWLDQQHGGRPGGGHQR